ncbi:MAG: DUF3786 domain-containing protein [Candidatus Bipolaricaulota bacterium]|nr:MAG: DUF3786 domain-containing protein [Candidatus Bipolaricaulota bacterium]
MSSDSSAERDRTREEWRRSMRPRIEAARAELAGQALEELAGRSGTTAADDALEFLFLGSTVRIAWPEMAVCAESGADAPEETQILLLDYLSRSDGSPFAGRWIGFQELPHGAFYRHAFQGYTGDQLVRDLEGDMDRFLRGATAIGGEPIDIGDAGYAFTVLPRVRLAVVWWDGDEEFPAKAHVLFDASAGTYLPTDGLAIVGRMLCRRLQAEAAA